VTGEGVQGREEERGQEGGGEGEGGERSFLKVGAYDCYISYISISQTR